MRSMCDISRGNPGMQSQLAFPLNAPASRLPDREESRERRQQHPPEGWQRTVVVNDVAQLNTADRRQVEQRPEQHRQQPAWLTPQPTARPAIGNRANQ